MNIPGYRIEHEIACGGMATVYLAVQESLDRYVALKVMSPVLAADPTFGERFLKEARTIAQLNHPHTVAVFDIGSTGQDHYIAMEYLAGGDLKNLLGGGRLAPEDALRISSQIAEALGHAHDKGFVHRDVKPENILFRHDGSVVLTDFGIVKAVGGCTGLTREGTCIGTPHYMSPEQASGKAEVDGRSDLYSLGIVLYEMLTGDLPYQADDTFAVASMQVHEPVPVLPAALTVWQPLLDRLMAKDPAKRFADAASFTQALQAGEFQASEAKDTQAEADIDTAPRPVSPEPQTRTSFQPGPVSSVVGGALLALLLLAGIYVAQRPDRHLAGESQAGWQPMQVAQATGPSAEQRRLAAQQARIAELLAAAGAALSDNRLSAPEGENALELYRQVLDLDAANADARQGLENIVAAYLDLAEQAGNNRKFDQARSYLDRGAEILPDLPALSQARQNLQRLVTASRFKGRADFSSADDYVRYLRQKLQPGMKVKALSALKDGAISPGLTGIFYGSNDGFPPCLVVWDKDLGSKVSVLDNVPENRRSHAYWVQWRDIEIVN